MLTSFSSSLWDIIYDNLIFIEFCIWTVVHSSYKDFEGYGWSELCTLFLDWGSACISWCRSSLSLTTGVVWYVSTKIQGLFDCLFLNSVASDSVYFRGRIFGILTCLIDFFGTKYRFYLTFLDQNIGLFYVFGPNLIGSFRMPHLGQIKEQYNVIAFQNIFEMGWTVQPKSQKSIICH